MRRFKRITVVLRNWSILILYFLFFTAQLFSVNTRFQYASIVIFSPQPADQQKPNDLLPSQDEASQGAQGMRLNKRFNHADLFVLDGFSVSPPQPAEASFHPSYRIHTSFFELVPHLLLRGPPAVA